MNAALVLIISIIVLVAGYIFYGGWLAKEWGIDPSRTTPAHELEDGMDYVPAKAPVLLGHHFSSIAGAGRCLRLDPCPALGPDRRYFLWRRP